MSEVEIDYKPKVFDDPRFCQKKDSMCKMLDRATHESKCRLFVKNLSYSHQEGLLDCVKCDECNSLYEKTQVEFGCHVDMSVGAQLDCVIDYGKDQEHYCTHASKGMKKEDCEFWKEIKNEIRN